MGITEILKRIWLFSANKIKSLELFSKITNSTHRWTQLIIAAHNCHIHSTYLQARYDMPWLCKVCTPNFVNDCTLVKPLPKRFHWRRKWEVSIFLNDIKIWISMATSLYPVNQTFHTLEWFEKSCIGKTKDF